MYKNADICDRILLQCAQTGLFETSNKFEVLCVAILKSEGLVDAKVIIDETKDKYTATVYALTTAGVNAIASNGVVNQANADQSRNLSDAAQSQMKSDDDSDSTLLTLASGGIALAFGMLPFLGEYGWAWGQFICWVVAASLWVVCLLGLLFSYWTSKRAFAALDLNCMQKARFFSACTALVNKVNVLLFISGLCVFFGFVVHVAIRFVKH